MAKFEEIQIFVTAAQSKTFSECADRLNVAAGAVSRAISNIEVRLGARLFTRTTRRVKLTEAGVQYFEDCKKIINAMEEADAAVSNVHNVPNGTLSISASFVFGKRVVAPLVQRYLLDYPTVSVRALYVDRAVNLIDDDVDVAIRIGHLPDSSLKAIKVGQMSRFTIVAPEYELQHGEVSEPSHLTSQQCVTYTGISNPREWHYQKGSRRIDVPVSSRIVVNIADSALDNVLAGLGYSQLTSYQAIEPILDGRLVRVLAEFEPPPLPIHVVHLEGRKATAKVRAFIEFVVESLRSNSLIQKL